jgi:hypothetical protein
MPHGFQVISDDLDPAKTALEWPPRSPADLKGRAHNPKAGSSSVPYPEGSAAWSGVAAARAGSEAGRVEEGFESEPWRSMAGRERCSLTLGPRSASLERSHRGSRVIESTARSAREPLQGLLHHIRAGAAVVIGGNEWAPDEKGESQ